jgi:hypothetical protein
MLHNVECQRNCIPHTPTPMQPASFALRRTSCSHHVAEVHRDLEELVVADAARAGATPGKQACNQPLCQAGRWVQASHDGKLPELMRQQPAPHIVATCSKAKGQKQASSTF